MVKLIASQNKQQTQIFLGPELLWSIERRMFDLWTTQNQAGIVYIQKDDLTDNKKCDEAAETVEHLLWMHCTQLQKA